MQPGGGGGAGGFFTGCPTLTAQDYPISVGSGGAGALLTEHIIRGSVGGPRT